MDSSIYKKIKRLIASNNMQSAKSILQPLIIEKPDDYRTFYFLAYIYHREGKFLRAIKNYKKTLELNPNYTEALTNISIIYNDLGKYEIATEYYNKAIESLKNIDLDMGDKEEINDMFAKQHFYVAELYMRYNRCEEALIEFEKALKLNSSLDYLNVSFSECLYRLNKKKEAISILEKIKKQKPSNYEARIKLGHFKFLNGEIGEAVEEWEKVMKEDKNNIQAKMYIKMAEDNAIVP